MTHSISVSIIHLDRDNAIRRVSTAQNPVEDLCSLTPIHVKEWIEREKEKETEYDYVHCGMFHVPLSREECTDQHSVESFLNLANPVDVCWKELSMENADNRALFTKSSLFQDLSQIYLFLKEKKKEEESGKKKGGTMRKLNASKRLTVRVPIK